MVYNSVPMNIVSRSTLQAFWLKHPETERPLKAWLQAAKHARWRSMNDLTSSFSKARPLNKERAVFEICGGDYRLIVSFKFSARVGFVKFIGTHSEYDRV